MRERTSCSWEVKNCSINRDLSSRDSGWTLKKPPCSYCHKEYYQEVGMPSDAPGPSWTVPQIKFHRSLVPTTIPE